MHFHTHHGLYVFHMFVFFFLSVYSIRYREQRLVRHLQRFGFGLFQVGRKMQQDSDSPQKCAQIDAIFGRAEIGESPQERRRHQV